MAGTIRRAELSPDRPLVVRLAMGRSTAISFAVRPEKVVPGSPQALEINFLGRDLTLRPLGSRPGNLIVYTKSTRYVILLQVVSEVAYDDAVVVNAVASTARPVRLELDTFVMEEITLRDKVTKAEIVLDALVRHDGRVIESSSFPEGLRCTGCILRRDRGNAQLMCGRTVRNIECRVDGRAMTMNRTALGGT